MDQPAAYIGGHNARTAECLSSDNPHPPNSWAHAEWQRGWIDRGIEAQDEWAMLKAWHRHRTGTAPP